MRRFTPHCGSFAALLVAVAVPGCQPETVVYHTRPGYYKLASKDPLPDEYVDEDGVRHVFRERGDEIGKSPRKVESESFQIREKNEDGDIVLRAVIPHHIVSNALTCFRNQEYELLWDQLIAEQTKLAWTGSGSDEAEFVAWCKEYRIDIARMLTRLSLGLTSGETVVEPRNGFIVCRFWPHVAREFRFKEVWMAREGFGLKLFAIR